jgi:peroxiredoxin
VRVVIVLPQRREKVKRYVEKAELPLAVLVDESRDVVKAYGVWHRIGLDAWNIARPALFILDKSGTVHYRYVGARQDDFPSTEEIWRELEKLEETGSPPGPE